MQRLITLKLPKSEADKIKPNEIVTMDIGYGNGLFKKNFKVKFYTRRSSFTEDAVTLYGNIND